VRTRKVFSRSAGSGEPLPPFVSVFDPPLKRKAGEDEKRPNHVREAREVASEDFPTLAEGNRDDSVTALNKLGPILFLPF
jgi:hypothetical protein